MTVDIKRLTAHLSERQQDEIATAYKKQAENETAAFLWCFFLGWMGAHRFFLRQWTQAFLHLLVALIAAGIIVVGVITNLDPTIIVLAALPFGLAALIWEVIDLFRIDDEVASHNLRLAETLIASTMLADTTVERQAEAKLDEVLHNVAQQSTGEALGEEATTAGVLAAEQPETAAAGDVYGEAAASATTERFEATTITQASDDPSATKSEQQPVPEGTRDWTATESASVDEIAGAESPEAAATSPAAAEVVHIGETVTEAETESGYSVTDSVDTVVTESVSAGEEVEETPDAVVAADLTPITIAEAEAPTWPNLPAIEEQEEPAAAVTSSAPDFTDMGEPDMPTPVADIGAPGAVPVIVSLGAEPVESAESAAVDGSAPAAQPDPVPAPAYIPPIVPVVDEAAVKPEVEQPEEQAPETLAELAGLATAAGVVGVAEVSPVAAEPVAAPPEIAHAEEIEQTSHMLKRIRVTRQIKVNGQVVEETSAEELIEADADPEPVRQRLRDQLHRQATARMAELGITPDQEEA